jgi:hypothetical protein
MTISEKIGAVVDAMNAANSTTVGWKTVQYLPGHRLEISNRLDAQNKNPAKKYDKFPLIAFNEQYGSFPKRRGSITDWTLNIAILAETKSNYHSEERDENVFRPILYPLYEEFLKYLRESGYFFWSGRQSAPPHDPVPRKFFGITSKEGNVKYIFNDTLDAIELIDLKLSEFKNC